MNIKSEVYVMKRIIPVILILMLLIAGSAISASAAEDGWVFQVATGSGYSFTTPLTIKQDGQPDIKVDAEYKTKAWATMAPYYDLRVGKWKNGRAWEFESHHHKLHLSNGPSEVQKFVISHGYNLNTVNYAWQGTAWDMIYRVGGGFVMTHPETIIRNQRYEDEGGLNGFHISGVTVQAGAEKRFRINEAFFFYLEGKLTASYAVIPVANGEATVPNAALHGLFGIGYIY
ncbi:MAG: hypothetical protein JSV21_03605 [Nitrospirota bacterium]|nr:MAG: hypothetical protein JSV21_03605 [Nitrospirota bacterium]